jgi:hypothetical protein
MDAFAKAGGGNDLNPIQLHNGRARCEGQRPFPTPTTI